MMDRAVARAAALARRVADDPGRLWVVRTVDIDDIAKGTPLTLERVLTVSRRTVVRLTPRAATHATTEGL
jgi:hypothetical protein